MPADARNWGYSKKVKSFLSTSVLVPVLFRVTDIKRCEQVLDISRRYRLCQSDFDNCTETASCQFHIPMACATSTRIEVSADGETRLWTKPWEQLPSSLEQKSSLRDDWKSSAPQCSASVSYFVHVTAHQTNEKIAAASRQIHVFVPNCVEPPLPLEDFGPEYQPCQKSAIRRKLFPRVGTLFIESAQPKPFVFSGCNDLATTQILLQVKLQLTDDMLKTKSIGTLSANVMWRLRSHTFVCVQNQQASPTTRQATSSLFHGHIVRDMSSHRMKMLWSTWTKSCPSDLRNGEWVASYPISLSCQSSPLISPTFSLPRISRRYSLLLDINISGPYRSKTSLRLPVQIVYQAKSMRTPTLTGSEQECTTDFALMRLADAEDGQDAILPPYGA